MFLIICFSVFFHSRVGGWEILSRPVGVETGSVGVKAMDLMIHAAAFGLGMKKSNIKLPWEREPVNPVFYKRPRLIAPPTFVAEAPVMDDAVSLPTAEAEGRLKWSRKTSLVPWPVAQDRALAKALESWRIIIMDDLDGSLVGRQIAKSLRGDEGAQPVEQILSDALAGKSLSTLRARASSLMAFGRWKKGLDPSATILPIAEEQAYAYVRELRELNAPRTKPGRFLEAVAFAFHMLGAEVDGTMSSPRVKGAVVVPVVIPKKKEPLTVKQIAFLENLAIDDSGQLGIFAGYCCMVLHMRLRWMDGQFCQQEPFLDLFEGKGFLECGLYHHKNAGRQKHSQRLLPAACNIPGITGQDWASTWLQHRELHGLSAQPGKPTMPAPLADGGWAKVPLEAAQATSWIRELLRSLNPTVPWEFLGTHSLKATMLSMMAKAGCDTSLRRLAGYHTDPGARMPLEYSRDGQAPVLHALQAIGMAIQHGYFDPDASRARRWPRKPCISLEMAMTDMSKMATEDGWYKANNHKDAGFPETDDALLCDWEKVSEVSEGYSQSEPADDPWTDAASMSSISDRAERPEFQGMECSTSDEEKEAEVAAPIVGDSLARDLEVQIHVRVFKHVISGCCHIAKESNTDHDDGDAVVLKCGKLATRNFEEVDQAGNYLPYKCSRCFAGS